MFREFDPGCFRHVREGYLSTHVVCLCHGCDCVGVSSNIG